MLKRQDDDGKEIFNLTTNNKSSRKLAKVLKSQGNEGEGN